MAASNKDLSVHFILKWSNTFIKIWYSHRWNSCLQTLYKIKKY